MLALLVALGALAQSSPAASTQSSAGAQDSGAQKARTVLDQMIQALGGQAYLTVQDMEQDGRGYKFYHDETEGAGTLFWRFWRWPDKERLELTKQRDWIVIYNGDKGYDHTFRGTAAVEDSDMKDYLRRRHYALEQVLRLWLKEPGTSLFYDGSSFAERKSADQITIMNTQNEAVDLFVDTNTHLPVKKSYTWRDPETHDRDEESDGYDAYRKVQGIMTPFRLTRYKNGEVQSERFINTVKYNQNLPDSMFESQVTWNPNQSPPKKK